MCIRDRPSGPNKEEILLNYILNGFGKVNHREDEPVGYTNIIQEVRGNILSEAAIWTGSESGEAIPGYQADHSIHRVANFLTLVVTSELNKFAEYHRHIDSVTEPAAGKRFEQIGRSGIFTTNSVHQVFAACAAEAGQILSQLLREETNPSTIRMIEEERRRDEYKSGPLGHALGIGLGFAGFGLSLIHI